MRSRRSELLVRHGLTLAYLEMIAASGRTILSPFDKIQNSSIVFQVSGRLLLAMRRGSTSRLSLKPYHCTRVYMGYSTLQVMEM